VSVATFVPKPHTPFQWEPLASHEDVERRQGILRRGIRGRGLKLSWSEWDNTWLEAALARGDRSVGAVIHRAWRAGARLDAWREHFSPDTWRAAFAAEGVDPLAAVGRRRSVDEALPWDVIDCGVTRRFLWREYERAVRGDLSPDCRANCHGCGVTASFSAARDAAGRGAWGCP
jgi:hypothetical protein